ncbi:hypothetical protein ACWCXX_33170 [Streptomyces sp. NPDC001732]
MLHGLGPAARLATAPSSSTTAVPSLRGRSSHLLPGSAAAPAGMSWHTL